jgi:hypothetical protein
VIENHQVGLARRNGGQRLRTVRRECDLMPGRPKKVAKHEAHVFIVVGEQQITHGWARTCLLLTFSGTAR